MPTVLRTGEYRFFFFSGEGAEPPHVHVEKGRQYAKFWLSPVSLARNHGFRSHELTAVRKLIEQSRDLIEEKWNEHFGSES